MKDLRDLPRDSWWLGQLAGWSVVTTLCPYEWPTAGSCNFPRVVYSRNALVVCLVFAIYLGMETELLHINVQRFRGGLVFKAHRLCVSLNSRLESNKEEEADTLGQGRRTSYLQERGSSVLQEALQVLSAIPLLSYPHGQSPEIRSYRQSLSWGGVSVGGKQAGWGAVLDRLVLSG